MLSPIAVLQKRGIDISNHIGAVQDVKALNWTNGKQYRDAIVELIGDVSEYGAFDDLTAKFFYLYLVQNVVAFHNASETAVHPDQLVTDSYTRAQTISERIRTGDMAYVNKLEDNSALIGGTVIGEDGEVVTVRSGRKGEKKTRALELYAANPNMSRNELISLFMKELDMSKPGATTYVYSCKKGLYS